MRWRIIRNLVEIILAATLAATGMAQVQASVQVDANTPLHVVNRGIYGQFVEHFQRVVEHGIWAELLENRKFYSHFTLEHMQVAPPWTGEKKAKDISYAVDLSVSMDGVSSQRMVLNGDEGKWRGIQQTGFDVLGGKKYVGHAWIKSQAPDQQVSFSLESSKEESVAQSVESVEPGGWRRINFTLTPSRSLYPAVFHIQFNHPGVLWVGAVSLMPGDNVDGMRKDVIALTKAMAPPVLRWPGGGFADGYDWRKAVGPRDRRPPQKVIPYGNPYDPDAMMDPSDFGTDEFLEFCRLVGAKPYITANFGSGDPKEAREWVEYCNGSKNTKWGARRAANGHPQPYNVVDWAVGNETWLPIEPGYSTAAGYAEYFKQFAEAMRKADPNIRITAVGDALFEPETWDQEVVKIAGEQTDMLSVHYYYALGYLSPYFADHPVEFYKSSMAAPVEVVERLLHQTLDQIDGASPAGKKIQIALDEWNVGHMGKRPLGIPEAFSLTGFVDNLNRTSNDFNQTFEDALYAARMLQVFMRMSNRVPIACRTHLVNSSGAIRASSTQAYLTAGGKMMQLYSQHAGSELVKSEQQSPTYDVPASGWKNVPYLDAVATLSKDKSRLYVHLLNLQVVKSMDVHIRIAGRSVEHEADLYQLAPQSFMARNYFGATNVAIQHQVIGDASSDFVQKLPPHSATILELRLR